MKFINGLVSLIGILSFGKRPLVFLVVLSLAAIGHAATVATPTFSPVAGTYTGTQSVTIISTTSGASIRYTTNGSTPSATAGTLYSGPVSIGATTTLKAIAFKSGSTNSSVRTGTFTIRAAAPTFSPVAGPYTGTQNVTITTATSGATIRFTTNGTTPSSTVGTVYAGSVSIAVTTTLKAIAYKSGLSDSTVTTGTYTIQVMPPVFSPVAGTYSSAQSVTITTGTSGATIRYTTNGTTPSSTVGMVYAGSVNIAATTTLKAIAYKSGMTNSSVTSGTYTINATPIPVITSATTATGQAGVAFSYQITASNSPTNYSASPLPAGVTVNTTTGFISGTPTAVGATSVSLTATNAGGTSTAVILTLTVNPAKPAITSATTATGQMGTAFSYQITASNTPTSFAASPLPAGLSVNTTTGLISGMPTVMGATSVSITATNAGGTSSVVTLTLTINPSIPVISPPAPTSGQTGAAFSFQVTASDTPSSYTATGLPPGLSINSAAGLISGTPTTPGIYTVTIGATNAGGTATPVVLTITILAVLPYTTDFEPTEGYVLGSLNGQLGWTVDTGVSVVSNQDFANASQSVQLSAGNPPPVIGQTFASSPGQAVEFFDIYAKPVAGTPPGTSSTFTIEQSEFAFQLSGNQGVLQAFSGNGSGGGSWFSTAFTIPLSASNQSTNWVRLTARLDFSQQKWDLYANAQMVAADIPFISSSTYLSSFQLQGDVASISGLDYLYAGPANPLFADTNNNGIDDAWETTHGLSLATNNRNTSPTGNGVTVVQAYVKDTDPNDFYDGAVPTLTILSGNNQAAESGQFNPLPFVISVKNATSSAPLVNAPVAFTVQSGGGKLAITNTGNSTLSTSQNLVTDVNGTAQVYYQQPAGTPVQSTVIVTAGNAPQITFTTVSTTPAVPKTISGLRLFLKADAGTTTDGANKISVWSDQSVLGNHATQVNTASQPVLVANVLNGLSVVRFDRNAAQTLNLPNLMAGAAAGEVFVVLKANETGVAQGLWEFSYYDYAYTGGTNYPAADGRIYEAFGSNWYWQVGTSPTPLTAFNLYNVSAQANEWVVRLNGGELARRTTNTVAFSTPVLGRNTQGLHFSGDIAELIIYDRVLTAGERQEIVAYLNGRFAASARPKPTGLTARAQSGTQVALQWADTLVETSLVYSIERQSAGGPFVEVATSSNTLSYLDRNLTPNTAYAYRVRSRAFFGGVWSEYSDPVSATTLQDGTDLPLNGVRLWLRADGLVGIDQSRVSRWPDLSGNGNHATQFATISQPTLMANALNGLPVVRFDRNAEQTLNLPNFMAGAAAGEVFVVLKANGTGVGQGLWDLSSYDYAYYGGTNYPAADGRIYEAFGSNGYRLVGTPPTALTEFNLYNVSGQASEWVVRLNGGELARSTTNAVAFGGTPVLGRNTQGMHFSGDIAELIVYDHVLTAGERQSIATYLNGRYTAPTAPARPKPTGLTATAQSSTQVSLQWSDTLASTPLVYSVERQSAGGPFVEVATSSNTLSYLDGNLTANTAYTYRVRCRAFFGGIWSDYSDPAVATTSLSGTDLPLNGVRLWLKADGQVGSDQSRVLRWPDLSGNGNHAAQLTTGNQPVLVANALNGMPVVRFDRNVSQTLNLPNFMAGAAAGEVFAVLKANGTGVGQGLWELSSYDYAINGGSSYPAADGRIYEAFGSNGYRVVGTPPTALTEFNLYNVSSQTNEWVVRLNGGELTRSTTNTVAFASTPVLGRNCQGLYFSGDIAEIIVYDHVLTAGERQSLVAYLNGRYTAPTTPARAKPTGLTAIPQSSTQVALQWADTLAATPLVYSIERQSANGPFVEVATSSNTLSYLDKNLTANTGYTYRVRSRAFFSGVWSDYSDPVVVTTLLGGTDLPLNGVRLWLKADGQVGIDQSHVTRWPDISGNGNHATQLTTASQPVLVANGFNGLPVVRFDRDAQQTLNLPNLMAGASAGEVFVVLKANGTGVGQGLWMFSYYDYAYYGGTNYPAANGQIYEAFGSNWYWLVGTPPTPLTEFNLYNVSSKANEWVVRLNGGELARRTSNTVAFASTPVLGCNTLSQYFSGDIAELIVYDHVLTPQEKETLNFHLNRKYTLSLPLATTGTFRDTNGDGLTDVEDAGLGIDPYNMDVDSDGVLNAVELTNGTDPFNTDTDSDGTPDATDAYPLDPLRWNNLGTTPLLTIVSGNNQTAQIGQFNAQPLIIAVTNSAGTLPLINAPVSFTVQSGGGQLAATNTGTPTLATTLNLLTDSNGRVQVYYRQSDTAYVTSNILFTAGTAQTTCTSISTIIGDTDGNWLLDAWESQHFGQTGVDSGADPDIDGLTNFQEFQLGSDPKDYYNGISPILEIVSGNNQVGTAGQFNAQPFVIRVKNASGTIPLVNAPVTFTVLTEGGWLALTGTGTPALSTALTIITDASGTVQVYYRQPATPGLTSTVSVTASLAQTVINTGTSPTGGGLVDTDGNGLADAWEQQYFGSIGIDPNTDPDGDGLTNIQEFRIGRNPTKAALPDTTEAVNLRVYSPNR